MIDNGSTGILTNKAGTPIPIKILNMLLPKTVPTARLHIFFLADVTVTTNSAILVPIANPNIGHEYKKLIKKGADIRVCIRCATARGHACDPHSPYVKGIKISTVYDIPEWVAKSDKVISLG